MLFFLFVHIIHIAAQCCQGAASCPFHITALGYALGYQSANMSEVEDLLATQRRLLGYKAL